MKDSVPFYWVRGGEVWEVSGKGSRILKKSMLGICAFSPCYPAKIAHHKDFLSPLVITNVYINEEKGECEESQRCSNFTCKLNKKYDGSTADPDKDLSAIIPKDWKEKSGGHGGIIYFEKQRNSRE